MFSLSSIYCKMCNFSIRLTQQYIDQIVLLRKVILTKMTQFFFQKFISQLLQYNLHIIQRLKPERKNNFAKENIENDKG